MTTPENKSAEVFNMIGNWDDQSKQLKEKFTQLTDADLKYENGRENELIGRIQSRLHKNREEVISIIKNGQPPFSNNR